MKRILSQDGNKTEVFHGHSDGSFHIQTIIDADPLLKHVQQMKHLNRNNKSEVTNYVGSVDLTLFRKWCEKKFIKFDQAMGDTKYLTQYLNDPDNARFKAINGKV